MAVIVYQCTVCNRTTQLVQNPAGFERIDRCTITNQCRGKLTQINDLPDYIAGGIPNPVPGVQNWIQRKAFFSYTQILLSSVWVVPHNLNTNPAIIVYVQTTPGPSGLEELNPSLYTVKFVDANTTQITLNTTYTGVVHCIARSTSNKNIVEATPIVTTEFTQITSSFDQPNEVVGELVIGIKGSLLDGGVSPNVDDSLRVYAQWLTPANTTVTATYKLLGGQTTSSTWANATKVRVGQKIYTVRSLSLDGPPSVQSISGAISDGTKFYLAGYQFNVIGQSHSSSTISLEGRQTWKFKPGYKFTVFDPNLGTTSAYTTVSASIVINPSAAQYVVSTVVVVSQTVYDSANVFLFNVGFGADEIIALFAKSPYEVVDQNVNQIINLSTLTQAQSYANIVLSQQQLVANPQILANIYPEIMIIE